MEPAREAEITEELAQHLEDRFRELVSDGAAEEHAQRTALEELCDENLLASGLRDVEQEAPEKLIVLGNSGGDSFLWSLWQDIRYGLLQLRRDPGFTIAAVLTLALGIGATTAIFSVMNGVLLEPLPYAGSARLVSVMEGGPRIGGAVSYPDFFDWQAQNRVFSGMATYHDATFTLTGIGQATHVRAAVVSSGLFSVLRAQALLGRTFEPEEDRRGADVVVLSYGFWRKAFQSDHSVVGRSITLDNHPFTVVGVMPSGFDFPSGSRLDLWTSVAVDRESGSNIMTGRGFNTLDVVARLKPGVSLVKARVDMDMIAQRLAHEHPQSDARKATVKILPEIDSVVGSARSELLILLAVVGGLLLIACVNVASLSLARNLGRQKEVALRGALGAHRGRVVRQFLTESVLLALLGGTAGVAMGTWGMRMLVELGLKVLPRMAHVGMDWRVLVFAAGLSLATGIAFGIAPSLQASRAHLVDALKEGPHSFSEAASGRRLRGTLVVAETALAMVLLVGAALLISSYARLARVNMGFNPKNVLTFTFDLPTPPYTFSKTVEFTNELLTRLRALPGVQSAATDWTLPLSGDSTGTGMEFEGRKFAPGSTPSALSDAVTPGYFHTMGIPLLHGRTFTAQDNSTGPPVVIVNQAFVRRLFPNESAVGRRIQPGITASATTPWREIVGVVGNVRQESPAKNSRPEFYLPFAQFPNVGAVVVRTAGNPLRLVAAVRATLASMDKNVPVYDIHAMDEYLSSTVARRRLSGLLLGLFGALALFLAALGIYGVVSYMVNQSKHEIGIRMALGAERGDVLSHVVSQGLRLAIIGAAIGVGGALGVTRFLTNLLYGVKPTDPLTFLGAALVLVSTALLACYIPARRATKVDPMVALRNE